MPTGDYGGLTSWAFQNVKLAFLVSQVINVQTCDIISYQAGSINQQINKGISEKSSFWNSEI